LSSMLALIQNENMKIFRRVPTWIMIGLLIVIIFAGALLQKFNPNDQQAADANWRNDMQQMNAQYEETIKDKEAPAFIVANSKKNLALNQYRLDHDLNPNVDGAWENVIDNVGIINVITLFTIIVAGGSVASEFSWGTIKLLLIRPVNRSKILLAKYISTFIFALLTLVLLFGLSFLVGALFFGTDTIGMPHLAYQDGKVVEMSMFIHAIQVYGLACVSLLMMVTFAFMVGTIFRNSSLSIGLAIFLMFMGAQVTQLIASKFEWAKYILFANMDLTRYIDGVPLVEGMTMTFSIVMLIVYFVVFNGLTWSIFNKRDVAA
jgi:ABC-2 type transport system permease protein